MIDDFDNITFTIVLLSLPTPIAFLRIFAYSSLPFVMESKQYLVTGGSSGIGLGIAKLLAQQGAIVHICGKSEEKLKKAKEATEKAGGKAVITHAVNLAKSEDVKRLVEQFAAECDGMDGLVLNASCVARARESLMDEDRENMEMFMAVNYIANVELLQLALPLLEKVCVRVCRPIADVL